MKKEWIKIGGDSKLECYEENERVILRCSKDGDCIPIPKKEIRALIRILSRYVSPIKISSRKTKARNLQEWCCERISKLTGIPWGKDELIQSRPMGQSGPDVVLLPGALDWFPWTVECKSAEQWNIPAAIKQVTANLYKGTSWLLILKSKKIAHPIIIVDGNRFFELLESEKAVKKIVDELKAEIANHLGETLKKG